MNERSHLVQELKILSLLVDDIKESLTVEFKLWISPLLLDESKESPVVVCEKGISPWVDHQSL